MRAIDVSIDDEVVVDAQGTLWVWLNYSQQWAYVVDDGMTDFDRREYLPEQFEPYLKLDRSARELVKGALHV
ncbi:hypothetical protein EniyanLRS_146 [Mycobacterium phage EniyanLRS]|uniref:Uncharacterized protein n=1 Tax=Mycobacterium phage EniyanLRS TaxID=1933770 RepID=A0A2I2MPL6_9CAUD|nr:hypothetical protein EniyanLRS_146 [Mycobacterium phage EniyanLRS]